MTKNHLPKVIGWSNIKTYDQDFTIESCTEISIQNI